jgi:hypothetical protein
MDVTFVVCADVGGGRREVACSAKRKWLGFLLIDNNINASGILLSKGLYTTSYMEELYKKSHGIYPIEFIVDHPLT